MDQLTNERVGSYFYKGFDLLHGLHIIFPYSRSITWKIIKYILNLPVITQCVVSYNHFVIGPGIFWN